MNETQGYIYCLSNETFPYYKLGFTLKNPNERCRELYTSGVPTPFKLEFAKLVKYPDEKEKAIHLIFKEYRINSSREFFDISIQKIKNLFDAIDGTYWTETDDLDNTINNQNINNILGCRDTRKCFTNGQKIRHKTRLTNHIWEGYYDSEKNKIIYNNNEYTMNQFVTSHYMYERPDRQTTAANAWAECECHVNDEWISTFNLKEL
jgi:hypothetical protein